MVTLVTMFSAIVMIAQKLSRATSLCTMRAHVLDETTKNRLRLWLRSERAMGLPSVGPADWTESLAPEPAISEEAKRTTPIAREIAAPPRANTSAPARQNPIPRSEVAELSIANTTSTQPFTSPILSLPDRIVHLTTLDESQVRGCVKCGLCRTRSHTVFGEGAADARLMFVGEGPGSREDQTGRPFVGPAGELLNRMIAAMGLAREQVYIANIVKCRAFHPGPPPKDRAPAPEEIAACASYLREQVEIIRPSVIVTLGLPASQFVLQSKMSMSKLRGMWSAWHGIRVMPTWHPAYLLRREQDGDVEPKRQAWSDLQQVMKDLGLATKKKSE
jgi:DNA polymerase